MNLLSEVKSNLIYEHQLWSWDNDRKILTTFLTKYLTENQNRRNYHDLTALVTEISKECNCHRVEEDDIEQIVNEALISSYDFKVEEKLKSEKLILTAAEVGVKAGQFRAMFARLKEAGLPALRYECLYTIYTAMMQGLDSAEFTTGYDGYSDYDEKNEFAKWLKDLGYSFTVKRIDYGMRYKIEF